MVDSRVVPDGGASLRLSLPWCSAVQSVVWCGAVPAGRRARDVTWRDGRRAVRADSVRETSRPPESVRAVGSEARAPGQPWRPPGAPRPPSRPASRAASAPHRTSCAPR